jgi:hypothetical protein
MKNLKQQMLDTLKEEDFEDTICYTMRDVIEINKKWLAPKLQEAETNRGTPGTPEWHFNRGKYVQLKELLEDLSTNGVQK